MTGGEEDRRQAKSNMHSQLFITARISSLLQPCFIQGFFQQFWDKAPGQNWEKMIDLTAKLGEMNDIEYNKSS